MCKTKYLNDTSKSYIFKNCFNSIVVIVRLPMNLALLLRKCIHRCYFEENNNL